MRPGFALVLLGAAMHAPVSGQTGVQPSAEAGPIDAFVRRAFALASTPALGVAVVHNGRTIYSAALGLADATARIPATDSTLWYIASTSKSFTGFAIALLEAAGAVDVNAPITTLLPRARWHASVQAQELNLAAFLSHTHGLGNGPIVMSAAFTGVHDEAAYGELLQYHPMGNRALQYSNLGYNVASMVIDVRRAEGWKRYLERAVYQPAGLRQTYARVSGLTPARIARPHQLQDDGTFSTSVFAKTDKTMNAAGGHLATLNDLSRWITVHMDSGRLEGRQVFPARVVQRAHEMLARQNAQFAFFQRDGWGMGWDIGSYRGERMVSRFGSYATTRSHISFLPARRLGVVAQVNGAPGSGLTDIIAAYVYDRFAGRADADSLANQRLAQLQERLARARQQAQADRAALAARQRPLPRPLTAYAGRFEDPALGPVIVSVENNTLRINWGVLSGALLVHDAEQELLRMDLLGSPAPVQYRFDASGNANAIEMLGSRFQRTALSRNDDKHAVDRLLPIVGPRKSTVRDFSDSKGMSGAPAL
jgi:CubicO group peptidase (beta-lactamase class C family)